ncbi:AraC family transcriptional regulator [Hyphomicrobium sp. NDB2Meth4]|uniref:helix-turn-helix domain-containing protein n=1 Tax=Hyphomicrobium sp. NDB2Meth4 TaxID=1892846 RepID=UPI00092FFD13|nr:AraC family transcriptional regulator [Hyphomicrobium sp. NDB2Meth4]
MTAPRRLNERAAERTRGSLWHVDAGWSVFAGPLAHNAPHAHSTAVYLAGLYDTFRLRIGNGAWHTCRAAVIRAGTTYEFDVSGAPLGVLYLEPSMGRAEVFAPLMRNAEEVDGALVGSGDVALMRNLFEQRPASGELHDMTADALAFARSSARRALDPRISHAIGLLQSDHSELVSAEQLARTAGLSISRFQHLFTAEVGVPFRRYRGWQRLRTAIRDAAAGSSLTQAAHAAGFADQAHFSRAFRTAFGAPPSRGL